MTIEVDDIRGLEVCDKCGTVYVPSWVNRRSCPTCELREEASAHINIKHREAED